MADRLPSPDVRRPRGRPKGTGIDDRASLTQIVALMRSDAALRATTAIRLAGVTDPSVIRRLRDKLKDGLASGSLVDASGGMRDAAGVIRPDQAAAVATAVPSQPSAQLPESRPAAPGPVAPVQEAAVDPGTLAPTGETPRQAQERALLAAYLAAMSAPRATEVRVPDDPPLPAGAMSAQSEPSPGQGRAWSPDAEIHPRPGPKPDAGRAHASGSDSNPSSKPHGEPRPDSRSTQQAHKPATPPPFGFWPFAPPPSAPASANPFMPWLNMIQGFGGMPAMPGFPGMPSAAPMPMQMPWMPPFLQPFQQRPSSPMPDATRQMEGMRLAVEAMTAMARLQLHLTENAMAYSPMALMLQGQAFVGQMLLAAFSGQAGAMNRPSPGGAG